MWEVSQKKGPPGIQGYIGAITKVWWSVSIGLLGSFPLTVTVTTMGYKNPLNKAPLRTVTGRGNDPKDHL